MAWASTALLAPAAIHAARRFAVRSLAAAHRERLLATYRRQAEAAAGGLDKAAIDARRLRNRALAYLAALEEPETTALALQQFERARNMSDAEAALAALVGVEGRERELALDAFYRRWKHDPLVLDKWFRLQALAPLPATFERVATLATHPDFTLRNPNRARSLLHTFALNNPLHFHAADGSGYRWVAEQVVALDRLNPQVASRLARAFDRWRKYDEGRQAHARAALETIRATEGLSPNVAEVVGRALA